MAINEESVGGGGIMSGQIPRPTGKIALVALLLCGMGIGGAADTARADDCLTAPNSAAPEGSHWYYHMDWANQRKCWYVRATDQPAQPTAEHTIPDGAAPAAATALEKPTTAPPSAPTSIKNGGRTAMPLPRVKPRRVLVSSATAAEPAQKSAEKRSPAPPPKPANASATPMPRAPDDSTAPPLRGTVQSAPMGGATTDQSVQQSAQNGSTVSSITDAPAAQPSLSPQTNDQDFAPFRPLVQRGPNSSFAVVKEQESTAPQTEARGEPVQPTGDAKASDHVESAAQTDASTTNTGMVASLASTPVAIFPVAALGLVVAGFLLRIVMKVFVRRRHRTAVDHHDSDWINDRHADETPDDQIVDQGDGLTDYLQHSSIAVASKFGPRRPSQVNDDRLNDAPDRAPLRSNKIGKRERRPIGGDPYESEWIDNKRRREWRNDPQRHESPSIKPRESGRIDDRRRHEWRDDQPQYGFGDAGDELIDDLQRSLVAAPSDCRSYTPLQDDSSNDGGSRDAASSDEIRERERALEQLRRSLDRLLRSPNVA
jgi:hypothetical protein